MVNYTSWRGIGDIESILGLLRFTSTDILMSSFLFEKEIRVFGMKRSGNSTTASFIYGCLKSNEVIVFKNTNLSFNPVSNLRRRRIELFDKAIVEAEGGAKYFINGAEHMPIPIIRELLKPVYCYDGERERLAIKYKKDFFSRDVYNMVLLRSPHNNLAGILKSRSRRHMAEVSEYYLGFLDLWLQYAEEVLCITDHIPNKIIVLFDKMVSSRSYRESISSALDIPYTEDGINFIGKNIGDSFKTYRYHPKWWTADIYKKVLLHPKVMKYTKEIFDINLMECFDG